MNLLSTLVLIPLLNPLLRYGGTEGGSTVQLEDRGVNNYFKGQEPADSVDDKVVDPLYPSREVWLFVADPFCSTWSFGGLLKVTQTI